MLLLFARTLPSSVLWCCLLPCAKVPVPGRRFDVVPDVVPHAAQLVLKTRHSLGPPMVGCPADLDVKEKEICMWPWHSMSCPADCTVLSVLAGVLNVQHIGACSCSPDPQVVALSPNKVCSSQLDVVLTSFQTSFHLQLSRSSRPDIVWALPYVGDSGHSSSAAQQIWK